MNAYKRILYMNLHFKDDKGTTLGSMPLFASSALDGISISYASPRRRLRLDLLRNLINLVAFFHIEIIHFQLKTSCTWGAEVAALDLGFTEVAVIVEVGIVINIQLAFIDIINQLVA